jgi:DNA-binding XRE family transcriptional regulator
MINLDLFISIIKEVWWAIPILFIIGLVKTPWFKGLIGEWAVNLAARIMLDKGTYHLIKNVTLPTEDGTTQIDHIFVSPYGVFVVETKNMKGWIFGGENQKTWTKKIFKKNYKFQNPLHQNYKHTKALEAALGLDAGKLFSVVVFVGESTFKTPMPENVTVGGGHIRYIKSKKERVLSTDEVARIIEQIESGRLKPSIKTHLEHAKHVRSIVEAKTATQVPPKVETKSCPRCGSAMVLRISKMGDQAGQQFWGCSTFPKCRGIIEAH